MILIENYNIKLLKVIKLMITFNWAFYNFFFFNCWNHKLSYSNILITLTFLKIQSNCLKVK